MEESVLRAQLPGWLAARWPELAGPAVAVRAAPAGGYSNELVFVQVGAARLVLRFPPEGPPLFPTYDLSMQVSVQAAAGAAGIPVPAPIVLEEDPSWLGRPFLAMPEIAGRHPGEAPALTGWVAALAPDEQRTLQVAFLDTLVAVHRLDWGAAGLAGLVRGSTLPDELAWWRGYCRWACADSLQGLFDRCEASLPSTEPPPSLLWGDVRLGNVVVGDGLRPAAVLDWEMATIGAAEHDVAWYTALSDLTERFAGAGLPGFLARDAVISHCAIALGRPLLHMAWFEGFALARAAAVLARTEIAKAIAKGRPAPDLSAHPVITATADVLTHL